MRGFDSSPLPFVYLRAFLKKHTQGIGPEFLEARRVQPQTLEVGSEKNFSFPHYEVFLKFAGWIHWKTFDSSAAESFGASRIRSVAHQADHIECIESF